MLNYSKMILERMTIDRNLFKKELMKAYKRLSKEEAYELYNWGSLNYPEFFSDLSPNFVKSTI